MRRASLIVLAMSSAACSGDGPGQRAPNRWIRPITQIAPEFTERVGAFSAIDVLGCTIVAADWMERRLWVLRNGVASITPLGRAGDGPGEFRHVRAVAIAADSLTTALDWGRRRLIQYRWDGTLETDVALSGGVLNHASVGPLRALPDGRFVDYWLADFVTGRYIPTDVLEILPLVAILRADGTLTTDGWGSPDKPADPEALHLRMLLQSGDAAVVGDSLFVLRNVTGSVEVYSLAVPGRRPVRKMELRRFREWIDPYEEGSEAYQTPWGVNARGGRIYLENSTLAFDIDTAGRSYVVTRMSSRYDEAGVPWAAELLAVYSRAGEELAMFRLPTRNTRQVRLARDGSVLLLAHADAHPKSGMHIVILPPVMEASDAPPCEWVGTDTYGP